MVVTIRNTCISIVRIVTIRHNAFFRKTTAINHAFFYVHFADSQKIWYIEVIYQVFSQCNRLFYCSKTLRIDRRIHIIHGDSAWHTANDVMWMRVFTTKYNVRNYDITLTVKNIQIMGYSHQMNLRW